MGSVVAAGQKLGAPVVGGKRGDNERSESVRRQIRGALAHWTRELRDLDLGNSVDRVPSPPSALAFLRDSVGPNRPLVVGGATSSWRARLLWSDEYLCEALGETHLTVALTPDGRADAVRCVRVREGEKEGEDARGEAEGAAVPDVAVDERGDGAGAAGDAIGRSPPPRSVFMLPCESKQTVRELFSAMDAVWRHREAAACGRGGCGFAPSETPGTASGPLVPYFQAQDSSLTTETPALLSDVPPEGPAFAREAFGAPPEAVNLWIGSDASYTSWHKDPFENIYCVMRGTKVFYLLPPCDAWRMDVREVPVGRWKPAPRSKSASSPKQPGDFESVTKQPKTRGCEGSEALTNRPDACSCENSKPLPKQTEKRPDSPQSPLQTASAASPVRVGPSSGSSGASVTSGAGVPVRLVPVLESPRSSVRWATCPEAERGGEVASAPSLPAPLVARVGPGETLYLPAHWWHAVGQDASDDETHRVVAVNYWYEARMGSVWAGAESVDLLARIVQGEVTAGENNFDLDDDGERCSSEIVSCSDADSAESADTETASHDSGDAPSCQGARDAEETRERNETPPSPPPPPSDEDDEDEDDLATEEGGWWKHPSGKRDHDDDDDDDDDEEEKDDEEKEENEESEGREKVEGGWWDWSGKGAKN